MSGREMAGYCRRRSKEVRDILDQNYNAKNIGYDAALRTLLIDVRHFCDYRNLPFADTDKLAHEIYQQEHFA